MANISVKEDFLDSEQDSGSDDRDDSDDSES